MGVYTTMAAPLQDHQCRFSFRNPYSTFRNAITPRRRSSPRLQPHRPIPPCSISKFSPSRFICSIRSSRPISCRCLILRYSLRCSGQYFRINILPRVDFHLKLMVAPFESTVHDHGHHFGITVLEGLVLDVDVFRLGPFPDAIPVLTVLGTILGNMDTKENLSAARIQALFLPKLLTTPRFRKLHTEFSLSWFWFILLFFLFFDRFLIVRRYKYRGKREKMQTNKKLF